MKKENWDGVLEVAEHLYEKANQFTDPEYPYRSSISRSYYASYHCIKKWEMNHGFYRKTGNPEHKSDHRDVVNCLPDVEIDIRNKFNDLLFWRESSDYFKECAINFPMIAERSLNYAKEMCKKYSEDM